MAGSVPLCDGVIDLGAAVVRRGAEPVGLSPIEHRLLEYLASRPGEVCGRDELLVRVWGYRPGVRSRTIDNTVRRLREKIERDPAKPIHLHSIYGRGLKLIPGRPAPEPRTSGIVGRRLEIRQAMAALDAERWVSLIGPPGAGKSSLAREVAERRGREVVPVDLRGSTTASDLLVRVAVALGLPTADGAVLARALASRPRRVLILDSVEGVADALRDQLPRWFEAPDLEVIATSRAPIADEPRVAVGPMEPVDAAELFRLRAAGRSREPVGDDPELRALLAGVDHLPLAVELLAARTAILTVRQMVDRLDRRLDLLGAMRSSVDAAVADLSDADRTALRGLAAFAGRFELEDAEAVLADPLAADRLQSLSDRGLLMVLEDGGYALYEVVRDRVREVSPPRDETARHARWFGRLAEPTPTRRARVHAAFVELRAAVDHPDPELAVPCALALLAFYGCYGPLGAGRSLVTRLEALPLTGRQRAATRYHAADFELLRGDTERAAAIAESGLPYAEDVDGKLTLEILRFRALRLGGRMDEALARIDAVAPLVAEASDALAGWFHRFAGDTAQLIGDSGAAEAHFLRGRAAARRAGDKALDQGCASALASVLANQGRWVEARALYRAALDAASVPRSESTYRIHLGLLERVLGNVEAARAELDRAEQLSIEAGAEPNLIPIRTTRAMMRFDAGAPEDAELELASMLNRAPDHPTHAWTWLALGQVRLARGSPAAWDPLERALRIASGAGFEPVAAEARASLAARAASRGDLEGARADLADAERVLARVGRPLLAKLHALAAGIEAWWGDPGVARARVREAEALGVDLGLPPQGTELAAWLAWAERGLDAIGPRLVAG